MLVFYDDFQEAKTQESWLVFVYNKNKDLNKMINETPYFAKSLQDALDYIKKDLNEANLPQYNIVIRKETFLVN